MSSDLIISAIHINTPIVAGCPVSIRVDILNKGTDPARLPFDVCLDISTSLERRPEVHEDVVLRDVEGNSVRPGMVATAVFPDVRFPCARQAYVTATADCRMSVGNNARTDPRSTVAVRPLRALPWLLTVVRVGLRDSSGHIVWNPTALCPGSSLVVEGQITNQGCAAAGNTVTALTLMDGNGQVITSLTQTTLPIPAGGSTVAKFDTALPSAAAGDQVTIQVCADSGSALVQCDTLHLCGSVTLPLPATPAQPLVTFVVNGDIFPGESASITWKIKNFCSDLVSVTAKVSFVGSVLYTSVPLQVGLQDIETGEDNVGFMPTPAVQNPFYKVGSKSILLEIVATGNNPGPYKASAVLVVKAEPVSGSWWTFITPPAGIILSAAWKTAYTITGSLSNHGHTGMTPVSLVLNEVDTSTNPPTPTNSLTAATPVVSIAAGASGAASWPGIVQSWAWLSPGSWLPNAGPVGKTFSYTVAFQLEDDFGNPYSTQTSSSASAFVAVSNAKLSLAEAAAFAQFTAICFALAAATALAGVITAGAAGALLGAAAIAEAAALAFAKLAYDPPVPDFVYREAVTMVPLPLPVRLSVLPMPLRSLLELVARIAAAVDALSRIASKLIGAAIDNDVAGLRLQLGSQTEVRRSLALSSQHLPTAASDAIAAIHGDKLFGPLLAAPRLRRGVAQWQRRGTPQAVRSQWLADQLPVNDFQALDTAIRRPNISVEPLETALPRLVQALQRLAQEADREAQTLRADIEGELMTSTLTALRS